MKQAEASWPEAVEVDYRTPGKRREFRADFSGIAAWCGAVASLGGLPIVVLYWLTKSQFFSSLLILWLAIAVVLAIVGFVLSVIGLVFQLAGVRSRRRVTLLMIGFVGSALTLPSALICGSIAKHIYESQLPVTIRNITRFELRDLRVTLGAKTQVVGKVEPFETRFIALDFPRIDSVEATINGERRALPIEREDDFGRAVVIRIDQSVLEWPPLN